MQPDVRPDIRQPNDCQLQARYPKGLTDPSDETESAQDWFYEGAFQHAQGRLEPAIASYRKALLIDPQMSECLFNLGLVLQEAGRPDEAIDCYRTMLSMQPLAAEAYNNLGDAYQTQGSFQAAAECFQQALAIKPSYTDAHYNLGRLYHLQNRIQDAISCYCRTLEIEPHHAKASNNLGKACQDIGQIDAAITWYERALGRKPDYAEARFNLATARLLQGDFKRAWPDYEWRFQRSDWMRTYPHRLQKPRWNGEPFEGRTLLIHCEQGFGDMFQFVRYLPMVKARGGTVVLETRQAVRQLFETLPGVDRLVIFSPEHPPTVDFDCYAPLLSLPGIFQTSLETVPRNVPYLMADPLRTQQWETVFQRNELNVGLVWAGTATDPRRASPLAWFAPLTHISGLRVHGLQKGPAADQLQTEGLPTGMQMENIGPRLHDFSDTAAVIARLDVIVSIDTSVAHLAAAMGKPVYLLLPDVPDWRWLLQRDDSPWYPTMRLFRQQTPGDWGPPLTRIARRLEWLSRNLLRAHARSGSNAWLAVANHLHHQHHPIEASIFYQRVLSESGDEPEAIHGLGLIALQAGNPIRAVELIKKSIEATPPSDRYYYNLGLAFLALECREHAAAAFRTAQELNPLNSDAEFNLKRLLRAGNQLAEVQPSVRQAVSRANISGLL